MGIEFGWKVATEVIGWLQQAVSAAKDRRQQRFAHIIGNAGVIVAGLRSIDRELHRLFLPLVYFDPEGWAMDKRREWAERILSLANEDVILPRMRAADSALATLASQETDAEIVGLIEESAGINRHGGGDGRALRRRASDPRRPRVMRRRPARAWRSVDRGTCRPGY